MDRTNHHSLRMLMRKMTMISNTMILMKMIDAWYSIIISSFAKLVWLMIRVKSLKDDLMRNDVCYRRSEVKIVVEVRDWLGLLLLLLPCYCFLLLFLLLWNCHTSISLSWAKEVVLGLSSVVSHQEFHVINFEFRIILFLKNNFRRVSLMNPLNSVFLLHHSQLIRVDAWFLDRFLFNNVAG